MKIQIRGKKREVLVLAVLAISILVMGAVRLIQFPDKFALIISSVIVGETGIVFIVINKSTITQLPKERAEQAEILTTLLKEYTSMSLKDCAQCALKQLSVVANSDYQHKEANELEEGMYFGVVGEEGERGITVKTMPIIVEADTTYVLGNENKRIDIRTLKLIAVDMNSYVDDEEMIDFWKNGRK